MATAKPSSSAGYSGTTLSKKLGIKDGFRIRLEGQPPDYFKMFDLFPNKVELCAETASKKDLIHYFTRQASKLHRDLPALKNEITSNGTIWISWPKKASGVQTDVTEDVIRNMALSFGLVDVKVCAIDEIWSGLKLVIPLKDRK